MQLDYLNLVSEFSTGKTIQIRSIISPSSSTIKKKDRLLSKGWQTKTTTKICTTGSFATV